MDERDEGLVLAIKAAGGLRPLAFELGMSVQAFCEWRRVPAHRILQVEAVTKVPREKLRPDLYRVKLPESFKVSRGPGYAIIGSPFPKPKE